MANWSILKNAIASVIKTNGNQEITGQILQNTLNSIVNAIGENATFAGIATPSTNPGTPDGPVFYIASEPGTYANFGGVTLNNQVVIFSNKNGSWVKTNSGIATAAKVSEIDGKIKSTRHVVVTNSGSLSNPSLDTNSVSNLISVIYNGVFTAKNVYRGDYSYPSYIVLSSLFELLGYKNIGTSGDAEIDTKSIKSEFPGAAYLVFNSDNRSNVVELDEENQWRVTNVSYLSVYLPVENTDKKLSGKEKRIKYLEENNKEILSILFDGEDIINNKGGETGNVVQGTKAVFFLDEYIKSFDCLLYKITRKDASITNGTLALINQDNTLVYYTNVEFESNEYVLDNPILVPKGYNVGFGTANGDYCNIGGAYHEIKLPIVEGSSVNVGGGTASPAVNFYLKTKDGNNDVIDILGDSWSQLETEAHEGWQYTWANILINEGYDVNCVARSGAGFIKNTDTYPSLFSNQIPRLRDNANIVVVFVGVNDYANSNKTMGTAEEAFTILYDELDTENIETTTICDAAYKTMWALRKKYINKKIYFMSTGANQFATENVKLNEFVENMKKICQRLGIFYLDCFAYSLPSYALPDKLTWWWPAGPHPSNDGQKLYANIWKSLLSLKNSSEN